MNVSSEVDTPVKEFLLDIKKDFTIQDVYDHVKNFLLGKYNGEIPSTLTEHTEKNSEERWLTRTRVLFLKLMREENSDFIKVGRGLYSRKNNIEEIDDLESLQIDEEDGDGGGFIYSFSICSMPGLIKVGRAKSLQDRIKQHRQLHSKAGFPDALVVEMAWKVSDQISAEKLIHSFLKLEKRNYSGNGSGKEWFKIDSQYLSSVVDIFVQRGMFEKVPHEKIEALNID